MSDLINIFDRDKFLAKFGIWAYEPYEERTEQREKLRVMRESVKLEDIIAESFHFTKEEFIERIRAVLTKEASANGTRFNEELFERNLSILNKPQPK